MNCVLIVGKFREDNSTDLCIAGAIDYGTYEIVDYAESDEMIRKMKLAYDPALDLYDWAEIVVEIDKAKLLSFFDKPTVTAEVPAPGWPSGGRDPKDNPPG